MSNRQSLMFPDIYADVLDKKKDYNRIIIDPRVSAHIRETELALACISPGSSPPEWSFGLKASDQGVQKITPKSPDVILITGNLAQPSTTSGGAALI